MLGEAAQDRELRAQHVAFGNRGDDLAGGELDGGQRLVGVDARHGDGDGGGFAALTCRHLFGAQDGGLHGEDLDDHVGDGAHDLLLVGDLLHVLLRGGAGGEEGELLRVGEEIQLVGERAFAIDLFAVGRTSPRPSAF